MASTRVFTPSEPTRNLDHSRLLAERLRAARTARGITLRGLASRIGVSASLISQVETGKVQPSVNTLYALATELELSIDELLFPEAHPHRSTVKLPHVQRPDDRTVIELGEGVRWERLTGDAEPGRDFLAVVYEPGGASTPVGELHRHAGREWGYVMAGTLQVEVGPETHLLNPGEAITFRSSTPHRLSNPGDEPVRAIWFVLGRAGDSRLPDGD